MAISWEGVEGKDCEPRHTPYCPAGCLTAHRGIPRQGNPCRLREAGLKNQRVQILAEKGKLPGKRWGVLLINSSVGEEMCVVCLCSICLNIIFMRSETLPFVLTIHEYIINHP